MYVRPSILVSVRKKMTKRILLKLIIKHFTKPWRHYNSSKDRKIVADILQYELQLPTGFSWLDFVVASYVSGKIVENAERHTLSYVWVPPRKQQVFRWNKTKTKKVPGLLSWVHAL